MFFLVRINPAVEPVSQSPIQDGNVPLMLHEVREHNLSLYTIHGKLSFTFKNIKLDFSN